MEANGLTVDGVLAETLPKQQPFGLLSGPMLADELRAGAGGAAVVATKNKKHYELVRQLFVVADYYSITRLMFGRRRCPVF
jgi:glycerol-3-phosphate dehydrogenase